MRAESGKAVHRVTVSSQETSQRAARCFKHCVLVGVGFWKIDESSCGPAGSEEEKGSGKSLSESTAPRHLFPSSHPQICSQSSAQARTAQHGNPSHLFPHSKQATEAIGAGVPFAERWMVRWSRDRGKFRWPSRKFGRMSLVAKRGPMGACLCLCLCRSCSNANAKCQCQMPLQRVRPMPAAAWSERSGLD